jgi:F0F1-type ATP synthase assembly protein I
VKGFCKHGNYFPGYMKAVNFLASLPVQLIVGWLVGWLLSQSVSRKALGIITSHVLGPESQLKGILLE